MPTVQGALKNGSEEAALTRDMPKPSKFPCLDSCQKRFLWSHEEVDLALHPIVDLVLHPERHFQGYSLVGIAFTFIFTYPLIEGVVWAPEMSSQPVSTIVLCFLLPSWTWQTPGLDVVFPPLFLSAFSTAPFHCALQYGFGQT